MKLKALLCAGLMLATSIIIPSEVYAETTYASASELITDAIEVAVTGVTSTTYDTAISNMQGKITMSGDMVSYDGTPIGYWYSDNSDTIWSDSGRTSTVLTPTDDGVWEFKPAVLQDILTDFNNDLIENVVPATEDWSKIIGKYDITLGNVTIPADDWHPLDINNDDSYYYLSKDIGFTFTDESWRHQGIITVTPYIIDDEGQLFVSGDMYLFSYETTAVPAYIHSYGSSDEKTNLGSYLSGYATYAGADYPYLAIQLEAPSGDNEIVLWPGFSSNSTLSDLRFAYRVDNGTNGSILYNINDETQVFDGDFSTCEGGVFTTVYKEGFAYNNGYTQAYITNYHNNIFSNVSSSKKQIGNTLLKQRLSKFSALTADDTVEVSSIGWTVIGLGGEEQNFDTYFGTQGILNAGDTADIAAVADAEALAFYVVAPTSLPVYMDSKGVISVATNASIENKSAASVTLTSVKIEPKAESGWTMVQTTPSRKRDTNEFTFSTSLVADTAIDTGAEHPFTYAVDLSPTTEGFESLDLASVLVTVDWTEVT